MKTTSDDSIVYLGRVMQEGDRYLIDFPDLPGCQTFAGSPEKLIAMARDAVTGWLVVSLIQNEGIPSAHTRMSDYLPAGSSWLIVDIPRASLASQLLEEVQSRSTHRKT